MKFKQPTPNSPTSTSTSTSFRSEGKVLKTRAELRTAASVPINFEEIADLTNVVTDSPKALTGGIDHTSIEDSEFFKTPDFEMVNAPVETNSERYNFGLVAAINGRFYIASNTNPSVTSFCSDDGKPLNTIDMPYGATPIALCCSEHTLFVLCSNPNLVYCIDLSGAHTTVRLGKNITDNASKICCNKSGTNFSIFDPRTKFIHKIERLTKKVLSITRVDYSGTVFRLKSDRQEGYLVSFMNVNPIRHYRNGALFRIYDIPQLPGSRNESPILDFEMLGNDHLVVSLYHINEAVIFKTDGISSHLVNNFGVEFYSMCSNSKGDFFCSDFNTSRVYKFSEIDKLTQ